MPFLDLPRSPTAPGRAPARVHVRETGAGPAVLLLHGGWGHDAYPFDAAVAALAPRHRVVVPDRVGYGRSDPAPSLPRGFHRGMAEETLLVMDGLGIERAALWGHSDGAVIAAWLALIAPARVSAIVLEAFHVVCAKESSVGFFEAARDAPETFGDDVVAALEHDHGPGWRGIIGAGGRAWLEIIAEGRAGRRDLYDGRLDEVRAPALILNGSRDPRLEPGEAEAGLAIPGARLELLDAGHSPHTSRTSGARAVALATAFLDAHAGR